MFTESIAWSSGTFVPTNAAIVASMIRMVSELEEITDALYRLIKFTERKYSKNREFTDEATDGVREMVAALKEAFRWLSQRLFDPLSHGDVDAVKAIEKATHRLKKRLNKAAMKRIQAEGGEVRAEMLTVDMNNHLGSLASYVRNVVEIAYYGQHPHEAPDGLEEEDE